tara:strand:- start:270 stop:482 length:213 start_codon:yes stop_codon:yes gene_type:complete
MQGECAGVAGRAFIGSQDDVASRVVKRDILAGEEMFLLSADWNDGIGAAHMAWVQRLSFSSVIDDKANKF